MLRTGSKVRRTERRIAMEQIGRFAPSPSGRMHLGNVFSAMLAWLSIRSCGGKLVLRIEDLDPDRCRREYADQIKRDLEWLGLTWDEEQTPQESAVGGIPQDVLAAGRKEPRLPLLLLARGTARGVCAPCLGRDAAVCRNLPESDGRPARGKNENAVLARGSSGRGRFLYRWSAGGVYAESGARAAVILSSGAQTASMPISWRL